MAKALFGSDILPTNSCFWLGAGISADSPSNLPLGNSLSQKFVDTYCNDKTWETLCNYFEATKMQDALGNPKRSPRLETILENIIEINGFECLRLFDSLYLSPPNANHFTLAQHLLDGGTQITTNFDNCIQEALKIIDSNHRVKTYFSDSDTNISLEKPLNHIIVHIHGKYSPKETDLNKLGLRISKIANGIIHPFDEIIKKTLIEKKYLFFLGYSGRDYFDINPYFYNFKYQEVDLRHLITVWVDHSVSLENKIITDWQGRKGDVILQGLHEAGSKIFYVQAHTASLLESITKEMWTEGRSKYRTLLSKSEVSDVNTLPELEKPTLVQKALTTTQIFSYMGIGKEVLRYEEELASIISSKQSKKIINKSIFLLSNAFRDTGLYRKAKNISKKLHIKTLDDRLFREGRLAGDYWLRGSHFFSALHFLMGFLIFNISRIKAEKIQLGNYEELLLDFLHWFRDVKSESLLLRLFLPSHLAFTAYNYFKTNSDYLYKNPHAIGKLIRLHHEIPGLSSKTKPIMPTTYASASPVAIYQEIDSVLGVINFKRGEILQRISNDSDESIVDELEQLLYNANFINDRAGVLKLSLIYKQCFGKQYINPMKYLKEIEWVFTKKLYWLLRWYRCNCRWLNRK